jgi:hypothetical protein
MPKYKVTVNFADFEVDATDPDDAQEKALGMLDDIDVEEIDEAEDDVAEDEEEEDEQKA